MAGCGGRGPGQILDKFDAVVCQKGRSSGSPFLWWASLPLAADNDDRNRRSRRYSQRRKKGVRSRQEIETERQQLWQRTQAEIDTIVDHFHKLLPRGKAKDIGAIYARYSTRFKIQLWIKCAPS